MHAITYSLPFLRHPATITTLHPAPNSGTVAAAGVMRPSGTFARRDHGDGGPPAYVPTFTYTNRPRCMRRWTSGCESRTTTHQVNVSVNVRSTCECLCGLVAAIAVA